MIDFPDNPTSGQIFIDSDNTKWEYRNSQWDTVVVTIDSLSDFKDVDTTSPVSNTYFGHNNSKSNWDSYDLESDDYFLMTKLSGNWGYSGGSMWTMPFNSIIEEVGTTGNYNTSTRIYTIPVSGLWEFGISYMIKNSANTNNVISAHGYSRAILRVDENSNLDYVVDSHNFVNTNQGDQRLKEITVSGSLLLDMSAGQRVKPRHLFSVSTGSGNYVVNNDIARFWASFIR